MADPVAPAPRPAPPRRTRIVRFALLGAGWFALALLLREVWFTGPYHPPEHPATPPVIVDLHCHTAGLGTGDSGCFISPALRDSYKFRIYLAAFGTTLDELTARGDALLIDRIADGIGGSTGVAAAVVLALDGAVDADGELDRAATEVYVPNEFVAREVRRHPGLLFGASINPRRHDALARLDRAAADGAVLVKWIPSVMHIDPSDERLVPFYRRMVELDLPLLTHAGQERSFTHAQDELADPMRLRLPLSLGVTVIAAHIASTGANDSEPDTERLARLMGEFPNLHSEISSLTQANKLGYLREALHRPEFAGRLCYGSDFPLINTPLVSPWFFPLNLTRAEMTELASVTNAWDRDIRLKRALGVPAEVFARTARLLRLTPGPDGNWRREPN